MKSAGATFRRAGEEIVLPKNVVLEIRLGQLFVFADALTSNKKAESTIPEKMQCRPVRFCRTTQAWIFRSRVATVSSDPPAIRPAPEPRRGYCSLAPGRRSGFLRSEPVRAGPCVAARYLSKTTE